jgi:hypothetical protein
VKEEMMGPRRYSLVVGALLIAALAPAGEGVGAFEPPESDRVLVTVDQGFLTVFAKEVEVTKVFQAIGAQSGIEISLVNPPLGPTTVTVTVERQPLEEAIRRVLQALSSAASLSYVILSDQDQIRAVKIFFAAGKRPAPQGRHLSGEPSPSWGAPGPGAYPARAAPVKGLRIAPDQEEQEELIEELQGAGVPEE